jgi:hypothetical protein
MTFPISERPKYLLRGDIIDLSGGLREKGSIIEFDGPPNRVMQPMNVVARDKLIAAAMDPDFWVGDVNTEK